MPEVRPTRTSGVVVYAVSTPVAANASWATGCGSRGEASSSACAWGGIAGWWSARGRGWLAIPSSSFATNATRDPRRLPDPGL